jgi:hypothetical protein
VEYYLNEAMRYMQGMDSQQWAIALIVAAVLGFLCMRGFGSQLGS